MSKHKKEYVKGTQGTRVKNQIKKNKYMELGFVFDSDKKNEKK